MLYARHDFLADIAALGEINAAELIHIGFMGKRVALGKVEAAGRHTERDAMCLIILDTRERGAELACRRGGAARA